jgi:isopentenyl diphosphate isomerase/L-lactate dehydrogenase-like FMN-dependent dehydrogenase
MGADYYSAALPFLTAALESSDEVIELIQIWQQGLKTAMFVSGRKSIV